MNHLGMEQFRKKQNMLIESDNILFLYLSFALLNCMQKIGHVKNYIYVIKCFKRLVVLSDLDKR